MWDSGENTLSSRRWGAIPVQVNCYIDWLESTDRYRQVLAPPDRKINCILFIIYNYVRPTSTEIWLVTYLLSVLWSAFAEHGRLVNLGLQWIRVIRSNSNGLLRGYHLSVITYYLGCQRVRVSLAAEYEISSVDYLSEIVAQISI